MSLEKISAHLSSELSPELSTSNKVDKYGLKQKKLPPVELWDPPYCGEINLVIKANGDWFYEGSIFKRLSLVRLLASVLIREVYDNAKNAEDTKEKEAYFLVTPVEKIKITVEDAPFVLTQWFWTDDKQTHMRVQTNVDDEFVLDTEHPMTIDDDGHLYVTVRRNLLAKVHRNVFYQWVDLAQEKKTDKGTELVFVSADKAFRLGALD